MKKTLIALILISLSSIWGFSQVLDPIKWKFSNEKMEDGTYEIVFKATIDEGWHLYEMNIKEGGPIPTSFTLDTLIGCSLSGNPYAVTKSVVKHDEAFAMDIGMFEKSAEFRQKVVVKEFPVVVKGYVTFMSCDDKQCLPPRDVEFEITINGPADNKPVPTIGESVVREQQVVAKPVPVEKKNQVETDTATSVLSGTNNKKADSAIVIDSSKEIPETTADSENAKKKGREGLVKFLLLSILAGFAGVLTPCVFPMIPMTVAFFSGGTTQKSKSVFRAVIFGLSILLIYSSLGIIVSLTSAGAGFANTLSTHWIPNLIFFALFVVFAASFLGAFEIILPSKWASSADSMVDKGGALASFFLGLTTVIVSFSCTGPIIGALLVEAASGDVLRPTIGMAGFGFAFALPFTLFALSPSLMKKLPNSGGWLNSIKVVLGFIMLAFSMKFISTVDSVYNLNIISRDIFIAIWIVIFSLMGLNLLGKIKFSHDSDVPYIGTFRLFLVILTFTFVVYLIPGMFGAPLNGLSSLIPSPGKSEFNLSSPVSQSEFESNGQSNSLIFSDICAEPLYGDIFKAPFGLNGYFDLEQGLTCAREQGKPLLIDFKGHACANCKLMESKVWSQPEILDRLRDNFVIVFLYTDDRTTLPEDKWLVSSVDGKHKKTIGKINEDLEISKYGTNAIPLYVITDHEGNSLNNPMPANMNIQEYGAWLDEGYRLFQENKK